MLQGNHRSFRMSPEPYMVGMRVKPRLRCIHLAVCVFRLSLVIGCIAIFCLLVIRVPAIQPQAHPFGFVGALGHLFIAWSMNYAGFLFGRWVAIRAGLLSDSEATAFQQFLYRWPEGWLEPRAGHVQRHPLDPDAGEPERAAEHSASRILKSRFSARAR